MIRCQVEVEHPRVPDIFVVLRLLPWVVVSEGEIIGDVENRRVVFLVQNTFESFRLFEPLEYINQIANSFPLLGECQVPVAPLQYCVTNFTIDIRLIIWNNFGVEDMLKTVRPNSQHNTVFC